MKVGAAGSHQSYQFVKAVIYFCVGLAFLFVFLCSFFSLARTCSCVLVFIFAFTQSLYYFLGFMCLLSAYPDLLFIMVYRPSLVYLCLNPSFFYIMFSQSLCLFLCSGFHRACSGLLCSGHPTKVSYKLHALSIISCL